MAPAGRLRSLQVRRDFVVLQEAGKELGLQRQREIVRYFLVTPVGVRTAALSVPPTQTKSLHIGDTYQCHGAHLNFITKRLSGSSPAGVGGVYAPYTCHRGSLGCCGFHAVP